MRANNSLHSGMSFAKEKYPNEKRKLEEIIDNIEWRISSSKEKKTFSSRHVNWFLKYFFRYSFDAIFKGYPIKIFHRLTIAITYEPLRTLDKNEQKRYVISDRLFGYMFCLRMYGPFFCEDFEWYPDDFLMNRLRLLVNSDDVYKLIKK
jgi:hypothetical protein